jgi:hypothetical protein
MQPADETAEYYRMREKQQRELAARALTEEERHAHHAVADNYRLVAEEAEKRAGPQSAP